MADPQVYRFGPYCLDVPRRRLLRGDEPVTLAPKAFDLLVVLLENRDRVVDKGELMQLVWRDSFVEEANLSQTIFVLRRTLGSDHNGRSFIDTVPRRGYRFAADVRCMEPVVPAGPALAGGDTAAVTTHAAPSASSGVRHWRSALIVAGLSGAIVLSAAALWRIAPDTSIRSIAVLPLADLSGAEGREYFADGLTEALASDLAQIQALTVVARTSTLRYRGHPRPAPEIGRELGVDGIVEGSVVLSGDRVRVSVQLVHARSDRRVWAQSYERRLEDILDLQREIARRVATEVRAALTPSERSRLLRTSAIDPRAHDAYLRGRFEFNKRTRQGFLAARDHFEAAVAIDPGFADAHAGIADCHTGLAGFIHVAPREAMPRAIAAATRALALNPDLADAHASLAYSRFRFDYDWPPAEASFRRAIALNPSLVTARQWYAISLAWVGKLDEARAEMDRALLIDPLSLATLTFSGWLYYFERDYARAIAVFDRALRIDPNYVVAHRRRGWALQMLGRHDEAIASFERARALSAGDVIETAALGRGYAMAGRRDAALAIVRALQQRDPRGDLTAYSIGEIYAALRDVPSALHWLGTAHERRSIWFVFLRSEPVFDPLRPAPGFQALLGRVRWNGGT